MSLLSDAEAALEAATKNLTIATVADAVISKLSPEIVDEVNSLLAGTGYSISYTPPAPAPAEETV